MTADTTRAERLYLAAIGLLALVALVAHYAHFGFAGVRADTAWLRNERARLEQEVRMLKTFAEPRARDAKATAERTALEGQLREIDRKLPAEHRPAVMLRSLEDLAGSLGATLGPARRHPAHTRDRYVEIPLEVELTGSYAALLKLTEQLERSDPLLTVGRLRVQWLGPPGPGPTSGRVRASLWTVAYQVRPEAAR